MLDLIDSCKVILTVSTTEVQWKKESANTVETQPLINGIF